MNADKHLQAAAAYIAVAESGDAKRVAYEKAADEVIAARKADSTLTQRQVAQRLGWHESKLSQLLTWRRLSDQERAQRMPHSNAEYRRQWGERKVPTRHEDRVEMAAKLLADPKVVKATVPKILEQPGQAAARAIDSAVADRRREDRERQREIAAQRAADTARPLSGYMAKMAINIDQWGRDLGAMASEFYDELDALPEGRDRELIGEALRRLEANAGRAADIVEHKPDLRVIEGNAS